MYKWEIILFSEKNDIALNQIIVVQRNHKPDDVLRLWFRNGLGTNNTRFGPLRLCLILDGDRMHFVVKIIANIIVNVVPSQLLRIATLALISERHNYIIYSC
jgi:hypothetical protein